MGKGKRLYDTPENWSDLVGQPDEWDKKNITNLIRNFEREKFSVGNKVITGKQLISAVTASARRKEEATATPFNRRTGVKDKESGYRIELSLPTVLLNRILEAYPVLLRDDRQYAWFIKNFPRFKVR